MTDFTISEILRLREAREDGCTMAEMCDDMRRHTRDEVVEALDAMTRHQNASDAMRHVNEVLMLQRAQVPLVNGRQAHRVLPDRGRKSYGAQG